MSSPFKKSNRRTSAVKLAFLALISAGASFGNIKITLTPSVPSGAPVGATISWVATASDTANSKATFLYQFSIGPADGPLQIRRDFYVFNYFPWTPSESEGTYKIQVVARSSSGATGVASATYTIKSRIIAGQPVITPTNHPLVALYSMPACPAGSAAYVRFKLPEDSAWQQTNAKPCTGTTSLNFYIGGMRPSATYQLQQILQGQSSTPGPVMTFTTHPLPPDLLLR